jgi:anti-anti-sigma factor
MPELASSAQPLTEGTVGHADTEAAPSVRPRPLAAALRPDGDRIVVEVSGELDMDDSEQFRSVLRDALSRSVRGIDLRLEHVAFCDCSALNILLTVRDRALEEGKTVTLDSVSAAVDRLLGLTGTRALFARPDSDGRRTAAQHGQDADLLEGAAQEELRIEVAQLRRAMQTRPTIDLARGILMASFGLSSEDAWSVLVSASQNTNTKLHCLAGDLVAAVKGEALPEDLREHLSAAVARVTSGH